jgi:energy-coupling factor transporter ATP-binding protein EcfA2
MTVKIAELEKWFQKRPKWLQDAARRYLETGVVTPDDNRESLILCKREAGIVVDGHENLKPVPILPASFVLADPSISLKLESMSEIKGVNALAPRKSLEFGHESLVVIYGANGSGKSGYVRVLKHASGGRGSSTLHGDVFATTQPAISCKITYSCGPTKTELAWAPSVGIHEDLRWVALYDTDCARIYVNHENELTYEPPLLSSFRIMVGVCEQVDTKLAAEITSMASRKPSMPPEFAETAGGAWFAKINWQTPGTEVASRCAWSNALEADLVTLNQRLNETNPAEKAKLIRNTKAHLSSFTTTLKALGTQLNDEAFIKLNKAREVAGIKRRAAQIDATRAFEGPLLDGIASESWRELWAQARVYSESEAYKDHPFPFVGDRALCVLCQQELGDPAKRRFKLFEEFVKGGLETEAATAEKLVADMVADVLDLPSGDNLETMLDLIGVTDDTTRKIVCSYCGDLSNRRINFFSTDGAMNLGPLPGSTAIDALAVLEARFEAKAMAFDADARGDNSAELQEKVRELSVQKWLSQQKPSVGTEIERLQAIHLLDEARRLTNTAALSSKKSLLAEALVTDAFRERFKAELKALGGTRVRVCIEKTKASKGQVLHQIKLKDSKHAAKTGEVLSEGEFRIVSLAAFLADVAANTSQTPFIFDDPISSLDQDFEELTAARLVRLSKSRQVIVFTHRLSLLAMLEDAAEKATAPHRVISLHREPWGAGEPDGPPLPAQKPKKAINSLIDQRLPKAKNVWAEEGSAAYQVEAKALCGDIRITIERMIENDLLADVVQRFRRPINTQGKIDRLPRILTSDCTFLDEMMTKYSRYEHAQPDEAPVPLPEPDELSEDLQALRSWLEEFTSRRTPSP